MYCPYAAKTGLSHDCNSCIHDYNILYPTIGIECQYIIHKLYQNLQKKVQDEVQGLLENPQVFAI